MIRLLVRVLLLFPFAFSAGCASSKSKEMAAQGALRSTATSARLQLQDLVAMMSTRIENACDRIAQNTTDPSIRRNSVYFKLRAIPSIRRSLERADDQAVMMDLWLILEMGAAWLQVEGPPYFGADQAIMGEAIEHCRASCKGQAQSILSPEQYAEAKKGIDSFIASEGVDGSLAISEKDTSSWSRVMTNSLGKPLSVVTKPLSALDFSAGVSDVAVAGLQMAAEVDRIRTMVEYLPADIRWNVQLLLLEIEENLQLESVIESVARVSESSERLSKTAEGLPATLRTELETLLTDVDAKQANLQKTIADVDTLMASTNTTAATLGETGRALTETFNALNAMMVTIKGPPPDPDAPPPPAPDPGEESKPFDITEYGATAESLTETALALTAFLAEAKALEESQVAPALIEDTESMVRAIVNQVFLAGGLFVLFTAATMFVYRRLVARAAA